jgi:hypothetical protein
MRIPESMQYARAGPRSLVAKEVVALSPDMPLRNRVGLDEWSKPITGARDTSMIL